jgi:hypothetical protein
VNTVAYALCKSRKVCSLKSTSKGLAPAAMVGMASARYGTNSHMALNRFSLAAHTERE